MRASSWYLVPGRALQFLSFLADEHRSQTSKAPTCRAQHCWTCIWFPIKLEYEMLSPWRGEKRQFRVLFQKCVMHVSILIFSDVSVESLFRSSFTTPGSLQLFPHHPSASPPGLRLRGWQAVRAWGSREGEIPSLPLLESVGAGRGERRDFSITWSWAHLSFHFFGLCVLQCLYSTSLCIYKKKTEHFL